MTTPSLRSVLAKVAEHEVSIPGGRPTVTDIVDVAFAQFPDLVQSEADHLVRQQAARIVKDILRVASVITAQLDLPDLTLPSAIAVRPSGGDIYYVATRQATWEELQAGETERVANVESAQERLDEYREGLRILAPVMSANPTMTVTEAVEELTARTEAAASD